MLDLSPFQIVMMILSLGIGWLIKRLSPEAKTKIRKLIPRVTAAIAIVTQVIELLVHGLGPEVSMSHGAFMQLASVSIVPVSLIGSIGSIFFHAVIETILQTFTVTGAHSWTKNQIQREEDPKRRE